jgi:autotransporter-associated beta strand protein
MAAAASAIGIVPGVLRATDSAWTLNNDGNWNTAANWAGSNVPNGVGDTARFTSAITANHTITQDVPGLIVGNIEFNDNNSYTIAGPNAITIDSLPDIPATVTVNTSNGSAGHTIATNLVLNDPTYVTTNGSDSQPLSFTGVISGSGSLVKFGPGRLLIAGSSANTFSGDVGVNEGTLEIFKSPGLPGFAVTGITVGDGVGGPNADVMIVKNSSIPNNLTVNVRSSGQYQVASAQDISSLALNGGSVTISGGGGFLTIATGLSSQGNAATASISGPGDLRLPVNGSVLVVNGTPAVDLLISAPIATGGINKQGEGTVALAGTNTYGSPTTVTQGTLQIGNGGSTGTLGANGVTVADGATLAFNRSNAGGNYVVTQAIAGNPGANLLMLGSNNTTLAANNTFAGTVTISNGLLQIGNNGVTGAIGGSGNIICNAQLAFYRTDNITIPNNISGTGSIQNYGNAVTNLTGSITATGLLVANFGRLVLNNSMPNTSGVYCSGNGVVELASNGTHARVIRVGSSLVTTLNTAKLDLKDNKLILTAQPLGSWNGTAYSDVLGLVQKGRNGGAWNGTGIVTSSASGNFTTLGVATAGETGRGGGTFAGLSVSASDVLVMYTYGGDANLDGKINVDDYGHIDSSVVLPGVSGWFNGDFNYDGKINVDDYGIIDSNVPIQGAPFPTSTGWPTSMGPSSAVPEPAFGGVILVCILAPLRRRRTRNRV